MAGTTLFLPLLHALEEMWVVFGAAATWKAVNHKEKENIRDQKFGGHGLNIVDKMPTAVLGHNERSRSLQETM